MSEGIRTRGRQFMVFVLSLLLCLPTFSQLTPNKADAAAPESVSIALGETPVADGITPRPGDGQAEHLQTGEINGKSYWKTNSTVSETDPGANILYFYFNVRDDFLFENTTHDVFVTVEYYDSGNGSMKLQYDSLNASFKDAPEFQYKDTKTWKTETFKLGDAWFANRTNGSDFRLHVSGSKPTGQNPELHVASVKVVKLPKLNISATTKVYETDYATSDVVIANISVADTGAIGDGASDDTRAFQEALSYVGDRGGGVVFVPSGTYKITGTLLVPTGVTLRGDWVNPDSVNGEVQGTILAAYAGRGDTEELSFIRLAEGSGVTNLSIWYPEQTLDNPVPYPWTIEQLSGDSATVKNVTLVNAYNGIKIGPVWNELHYVRNLYGTVLKTGIFLDFTTDIGRLEQIKLSPDYWVKSKLPNAPAKTDLFAYMTANAEGIVMGRSDWEYMSDIYISGFKNGLRVTTRTDSNETANAQLYKIRIEDSNVALKIEGVNSYGLLISDSSFKASVGPEPKAIHATPGFTSIVQFNKVAVGGNPHHAVLNEGSGVLSFENSSFENWNAQGGGYAIDARNGSLILGQSSFALEANHIHLGSKAAELKAINSGNAGKLDIRDDSEAGEISEHHDPRYQLEQLPSVSSLDIASQPRPATNQLFNVAEAPYSADKTGQTDVSSIIQQALTAAGQAGGGTVYLPAGIYRVDQALTVPSGVELRGSWDVPHHTNGGGTVLFTNHGENQEQAAPFISLEASAGIRGLSVYYDKQSWNVVKPYAWTVQGKGSGVYLIDTTLINPYKAVDFGTYNTSGHYIDYVAGSPLKEGIFLGGGAEGGFLRNVQFNPHYYGRNFYPNHPSTDEDFNKVWDYQKENLDAFRIGNVRKQLIFNTFVYGSEFGIHFEKQQGTGPEALTIGHGTDGSKKGVVIDGAGAGGLSFINTELVSMSTSDKVYIVTSEDFDSQATFFNTSMWGDTTRSVDVFGGKLRLQQNNFAKVGERGINALGGDTTLYNSYFQESGTTHVYAGPDIEKLIVSNNLYHGGMQLVNESVGKVSGTDITPVSLSVQKTAFNEGQPAHPAAVLKLANATEATPISGKLELIEPAAYASQMVPVRFENIPLLGTVDIPLPFISADTLQYRITLDSGFTYKTSVSTGQSFASKSDLNSDVWPDIEVTSPHHYSSIGGEWGGPNDLSAKARLKWDNENLYVKVTVKDNIHHQTASSGDIWQGDSLQLGIDLSRQDGSASKNVNELGFARTNQGTVVKWRWRAPEGVEGGALNAAQASITRNENDKTTLYDLIIPFAALHGPNAAYTPGQTIGFALLVNENDGNGRSGFIEYNKGIGSTKDATQFGDVYLLQGEYSALLGQSAEAAVVRAEQNRGKTAIDSATNFVRILPPGSIKSGLEHRLANLTDVSNPNPGGSGGYYPSSSDPSITTRSDGSVQVKLKAELDKDSSLAKSTISNSLLSKLWRGSKTSDSGKQLISIQLEEVANAEGYSLELPSVALTSDQPERWIEVVTPIGVITLPNAILASGKEQSGGTITVAIRKTDLSSWSKKAAKQIGSRPAVDVTLSANGKALVWNNAKYPVTVSLAYTPTAAEQKNKERLAVWFRDDKGEAVSIPGNKHDAQENRIAFEWTRSGQYAVAFLNAAFRDLDRVPWATEAIEALAAQGVLPVEEDGLFHPQTQINRAGFLKLLVDGLGLSAPEGKAFNDVKPGADYYEAVGIARQLGIVNGYGNNSFGPDALLTREDAAVLIDRALQAAKAELPEAEGALETFADASKLSAYAKASVARLVAARLLQGNGIKLNPQGSLTRAEAAVLIFRIQAQN
ncbi:S-layer homology domain-containing protein [Paenibacillus sp. GCM10012307]